MTFLSFLFRSEKPGQFCQHQIYARKTAGGVYRCHPEDEGAELFCIAYQNGTRQVAKCPYNLKEVYKEEGVYKIAHKSPEGGLVNKCEDFQTRKQLKLHKR